MANLPPIKVFTLIVSFQGIVDLVHENGLAWMVVPDVSDPSKLALHKDVLQPHGKLLIEPHVPKLYVRGQISGSPDGKEKPCHRVDAVEYFDIARRTVSFEGAFLDPTLVEDRTPPAGYTPSPVDVRSLRWMPDLTALSGHRLLRSGLADGTAAYGGRPIVTASVKLDRGGLVSEDCWWTMTGTYWTASFNGSPSRAMASSIALVALVAGNDLKIHMNALDPSGSNTTIQVAPPANASVIEVLISNHPKTCGLDGPRDFAAHYVLRQDSESVVNVPLPKSSMVIAPGTDPQCSPGDNP